MVCKYDKVRCELVTLSVQMVKILEEMRDKGEMSNEEFLKQIKIKMEFLQDHKKK